MSVFLSPERRALFGGTFDPVHPGHVAVARAAMEQAGLQEVLFIPAAQSPLKSRGPQVSGALRIEMLNAALAGEPWARVSGWELEREGPSYSWITAVHFSAQGDPGDEWFWVMGADQWAQLERWRNWRALAEMVTFLVFARDGVAPVAREGVRAQFLSGEFPGSATEVREAIREGTDWESLVAPAVAEVIRREGLYRP